MRNSLFKLLLSILVLLASSVCNGAIVTNTDSRLLTVSNDRNKVFRISSIGGVEQVFPPPQESNSKKRIYYTNMLVAHGQEKIAYAKNNDLWVYDVIAKKESQLTHVGKPYTKKLASIEVSIGYWSQDDSKILYSVIGGDTEDPEGYSPTLNVRPADYGFYIYDLRTGQSTPLPSHIPGEFIAGWLKNGDLVTNFPSAGNLNSAYQGQFVRYNLKNEHDIESLAERSKGSEFNQVDISRDGNWLTFNEIMWKSQPQRSKLWKLNLNTKEITAISPLGDFAEYQWPKMSPDGERAAYTHLKSGFYNHDLVVNGRVIYSFDGSGHFDWIDSTSLVLFFWRPVKSKSTLMVVIDANTGKVKKQQEWKN